MCISNLENPSEYLNSISNCENDMDEDKPKPEGYVRLDADIKKMHDRDEMWPLVVEALHGAVNDLQLQGLQITAKQYLLVLKKAEDLL